MRRILVSGVLRQFVMRLSSSESTGPSNPKIEELATAYSQLTLKELSDLQRRIFKKLGHNDEFYEKALLRGLGGGGGGGNVAMAAVPAATAAPEMVNTGATAEPVKEKKKIEKNTFDVKLDKYAPEIKIKLIKELRTVTSLSIADAKKAIEKAPGLVVTNMSKSDAEKLKELFEKLGAKVELL
ncbi:unnamed protein product [Phytomonas sp. Hart1]|nr:unnamed protein product [Phytomonas sp. Hart1]|eukprot:CCW69789.1 unnamed protein product [Phytomonas sp. isolate Hart1]